MRRLIIGLAVAAMAISAVACSTTGGTGGTIDGTSWVLKTYDVSGTATQAPSGTRVDAKFASGNISGSAGCNVYNGPVTIPARPSRSAPWPPP